MVEVSVIIPVYNTEKYLNDCLDCIVNQTLKDIEIICVDDGSTDGSTGILEEYEKSDSRIKVIKQENQGQGAARNTAIPLANGKYIYFMDSDDTLELNALEDLYNIAEDKSLDMVIFKLINVDDETGEKYAERYYDMDFLKKIVGDNVFNYNDVGEDVYKIAVSPPGKLFKRDLISDIRFDESKIFEDNPFFIEAFFRADRVYFHDEYLYNRLRHKGSLMTQNSSFIDVIPISNMILDITKKYGHYDEFKNGFFNKKIFSTYYRFTVTGDSFKQEYFEEMKRDFLSFKDEVESEIDLEPLNEIIFKRALSRETHEDFDSSVVAYKNEFDLRRRINELKQDIFDLKEEHTANIRHLKHNEIARIDVKNHGDENNDVVILDISDKSAKQEFDTWLNDENGNGIIIESDCGAIDLKLKMVNAGKFKLWLKSIDIRDENDERIKCCIDYTSLIINGDEYLDNHSAYWHDEPFRFNKPVKDDEIIDIHVGWITYDDMGVLVDEINEKTRKHDRLTNESFKLMNKLEKKQKQNKKLKKELKKVYSSNSWNYTEPLRKIRNR
jgi:glycosyltransferase involved in cell wall biosynthesis